MGTRLYAGRQIGQITERLVQRVPNYETAFMAPSKLVNTLFANKGSQFREVVLVEYPREGITVWHSLPMPNLMPPFSPCPLLSQSKIVGVDIPAVHTQSNNGILPYASSR